MNTAFPADEPTATNQLVIEVLFENSEDVASEENLLGRFNVTLINTGNQSYLAPIDTGELFGGFRLMGSNGYTPMHADIRHVSSSPRPQEPSQDDFRILMPGDRLPLGTGRITTFSYESRKDIHLYFGDIVVSALLPGDYTASISYMLSNSDSEAARKKLAQNPELVVDAGIMNREFLVTIHDDF